MVYENPLRDAFTRPLVGEGSQLVNGKLAIPQGPGLGIEIDREAPARFRIAWGDEGFTRLPLLRPPPSSRTSRTAAPIRDPSKGVELYDGSRVYASLARDDGAVWTTAVGCD